MKLSFLSLLAILFIGLKLSNIIAWSWWLVLSPLWFPLATVGAIILVTALMTIFVEIIDNRDRKMRLK